MYKRQSYNSPVGKIDGDLLLRRQFKIEDAELKYMFDADIAIEDEILKEELGKTADLKLKTIVTTIQKEQNSIIRDLSADLLLVQGCAGSGKTSIALHRLAYLLYKYRNSLSSVNVMIFSPNNVFNAYIADVLPALGEDRVVQKSFYDFFSPYFEDFSFESYVQYEERCLKKPDFCEVRYSEQFAEALEQQYRLASSSAIRCEDIVFDGRVLLSETRFKELFHVDFSHFTPVQRMNKIKSIVLEDLENDCKDRYLIRYADELRKNDGSIQYTDDEIRTLSVQEWDRCRKQVDRDLTGCFQIDIYNVYIDVLSRFLEEPEREAAIKAVKKKKGAYPDLDVYKRQT